MTPRPTRALRGRPGLLLGVSLLTLLSVACAPQDDSTDTSDTTSSQTGGGETTADACAEPQTYKPGVLTVATSDPAFEPWMVDNDPTNGKGFESAIAYAVADQMGFAKGDVDWTRIGFYQSFQP